MASGLFKWHPTLASGLFKWHPTFPLVFVCLGKMFQPLDAKLGCVENRSPLEHPWHLDQLQVNVMGDIQVAALGTLNAAGVINNKNNQVDVKFQAITFQLQELLGIQTNNQKLLTLKADSSTKAQPGNDITYLDQVTHMVHGGNDSLLVLV
jgi:hypothetical protein